MSLLDTINNAHNGIIDTVREWVSEGWECLGKPAPAQIAAAMLMEADGQATYVAEGESSPEYPAMLYKLAYQILAHYHPRPGREATMTLLDTINAENHGIVDAMRQQIEEVWEYAGKICPEQIAAMMLGEAEFTDDMIALGIDDCSPGHAKWLRELAYQILDHYHPRPKTQGEQQYTKRLFRAEIENERHGGISPATLESAKDSLDQGYDPRITEDEEWDTDTVATEITALITEYGPSKELRELL